MSQLENDILNMAMYKIACYQDEMEKYAGAGHNIRKFISLVKNAPADTKSLNQIPGLQQLTGKLRNRMEKSISNVQGRMKQIYDGAAPTIQDTYRQQRLGNQMFGKRYGADTVDLALTNLNQSPTDFLNYLINNKNWNINNL